MIKNLILIALCAPLGWTAAIQAQKMLELNSAGLAIPEPDKQQWEPVLKAAKEQGDQFKDLESAVVVVVAVQDEDSPAKGKATKPVSKLIEKVQLHANARWYAWKLLAACADDGGPDPKFGNETDFQKAFQKEWNRVNDLLKDQKEIRDLVKGEDLDMGKVNSLLDRMESKDPSFHKFIETQIEWKKCEKSAPKDKFDQLFRALEQWPTPGTRFDLVDELQGTTKELDAFSNNHKHEPRCAEQVAEARLRSRAVKLAIILRAANAQSDITGLFNELDKDELRKPELAKFEETLRNTVQKLCDLLLPVEDFDENVLVRQSNGMLKSYQRDTVTIGLPGDVNAGLRLNEGQKSTEGKPLYDEFDRLEPEKIELLSITDGPNWHPPKNQRALEGTPYSQAIHAYNGERKKIKRWNAKALSDLKEFCKSEEYREVLKGSRPPLNRVEALSGAIQKHPRLFSDGP